MIFSSIFLAADAAPAPSPFGSGLMFPILMIVILYFVMIRPQSVRMKEHQKLIFAVKVGDHVVMDGGEHGIITSVKERTVMVKIADNVKVEYERSKIAAVTKKSDVVEVTEA